jgi:Uma2 family endonuclease
MSLREDEFVTTIEYPSSDCEPISKTDAHRKLMARLIEDLERFFENEPMVYVSGNPLLYYVEGDTRKRVAPDVFVIRAVGKHDRRIYKLWEEGRAPDVVIELSSRETWEEDLQMKRRLYAQIGVEEYYIFDPEYDYLPTPLLVYKLEEGQYEQVAVENGKVRSAALGLELDDTGKTLRFLDPATGRLLPTPPEETQARRQAEAALQKAEDEIARLRKELERAR